MALTTMIGAKIHRREDPRLVSGHGRYADDFVRPETAYMSVVRSPYAHARIVSIDASAAKAAPGVVAVYTAGDFEGVRAGGGLLALLQEKALGGVPAERDDRGGPGDEGAAPERRRPATVCVAALRGEDINHAPVLLPASLPVNAETS